MRAAVKPPPSAVRHAHRFQPAPAPACPPPREGEAGLWFVLDKGALLVSSAPGAEPRSAGIPEAAAAAELGVVLGARLFLGRLEGRPCWAAEAAPEQSAPPGLEFAGLRSLLARLPDELFALAGRAAQIVDWDRNHRYCGACGGATREAAEDRSRQCPACGLSFYPRISPAVIVAVSRGRRLLLASNRRRGGVLYSVLAGFVEPGESLEECVHREIREEVGLEVTNLRYFGSQPWPFPNSLMIAFSAEHAAGEIVVEEAELIEADWFEPERLPRIPDHGTISRALIDAFVQAHGRPGTRVRP